ncbi:hypothetical protein ABID42_002660 [Arcicella rosea]|uniref:hypothetical protein n=1 Tax=Arcicella rosea TaxID=502909 RepID=UPI00345DE9D6
MKTSNGFQRFFIYQASQFKPFISLYFYAIARAFTSILQVQAGEQNIVRDGMGNGVR